MQRRSGDQFCVYVGDRLVLKSLTREEVNAISDGELTYDSLIKSYIRKHLSYRYYIFSDITENFQRETRDIEREIVHGNTSLGKPFLNPR